LQEALNILLHKSKGFIYCDTSKLTLHAVTNVPQKTELKLDKSF